MEDYFGLPLIVIDDLYADPEAVRNAALGLDYVRSRHSYPGSDALLWIPGHELCPMLDEIMSSIAKRPVYVDSFHGMPGFVPRAAGRGRTFTPVFPSARLMRRAGPWCPGERREPSDSDRRRRLPLHCAL